MIIAKKVSRNDDGTYSTEWKLSQDQMAFLLTYAVNDLLRAGLLSVDVQEESNEKQLQLDFLEKVPVQELGKAS